MKNKSCPEVTFKQLQVLSEAHRYRSYIERVNPWADWYIRDSDGRLKLLVLQRSLSCLVRKGLLEKVNEDKYRLPAESSYRCEGVIYHVTSEFYQ